MKDYLLLIIWLLFIIIIIMIEPSGPAIRTVYNTIRMPYNYVGGNIMGVKWNVMCTQRGNKGKERDWGLLIYLKLKTKSLRKKS